MLLHSENRKHIAAAAALVVFQVADIVLADAATPTQPAELAKDDLTLAELAQLAEELESGVSKEVEVKSVEKSAGTDRGDSHHHPPSPLVAPSPSPWTSRHPLVSGPL